MPFIRKLEAKYGRVGNLWLMDRGVPSENTLAEMRKDGYRHLVGAPRGHLKVIGEELDEAPREQVQDGISVKVAKAADGAGDTFVLTKSAARSLKETAMRVKKIRGAMKTLRAIDGRLGRSRWRRTEPSERELGRDGLIARLAVAATKAGRAWKMIDVTTPREGEKVTAESFSWKLDWPKNRHAAALRRAEERRRDSFGPAWPDASGPASAKGLKPPR